MSLFIKKHKGIFLIVSLMLLPMVASAKDSQTSDEKIKAAIAYEKVVPVKASIDTMLKELKKNPQFAQKPDLLKKMSDAIDVNELRNVQVELLAKHFTLEEIESMRAYYSTDVGQSVFKKMGAYQADLMPVTQKYISKGMMIAIQHSLEERKKKSEMEGH